LRPQPSVLSPQPQPSMRLILFQRDDCHLCDLALEVLAQGRAPDFVSVFIDKDAELEQRYGERVPVLRDDVSGPELGWPVDGARGRSFLPLDFSTAPLAGEVAAHRAAGEGEAGFDASCVEAQLAPPSDSTGTSRLASGTKEGSDSESLSPDPSPVKGE